MTKSVDESLAPVPTLDTEAFPVPDKTPLKNGVHSAEQEGAIQVQVEVAATRLGKVGAGMARAIAVPANWVVDALALGLDGPKPVRERLFVQCRQGTDGGPEAVIAVNRSCQGPRQDVLRDARHIQTTQHGSLADTQMCEGV